MSIAGFQLAYSAWHAASPAGYAGVCKHKLSRLSIYHLPICPFCHVRLRSLSSILQLVQTPACCVVKHHGLPISSQTFSLSSNDVFGRKHAELFLHRAMQPQLNLDHIPFTTQQGSLLANAAERNSIHTISSVSQTVPSLSRTNLPLYHLHPRCTPLEAWAVCS
jgi:hypothetical protein